MSRRRPDATSGRPARFLLARFVVEPGPVTISAGTSSVDPDGSVAIELVGSTVVDPQRTLLSSVEVDRAEG